LSALSDLIWGEKATETERDRKRERERERAHMQAHPQQAVHARQSPSPAGGAS